MKGKIGAIEDGDLRGPDVQKIATDLGVTEDEVVSMNRRMAMGGDTSLNAPLREEGEGEWQDWLVDSGPLQDEMVADAQERDQRHALLAEAMAELNERERDILTRRRLIDEPETLETLSQDYGISRERVRQIEVRAFEKLAKAMHSLAAEQRLLPAD
jgi:RNA polymerase sigma-32 factor